MIGGRNERITEHGSRPSWPAPTESALSAISASRAIGSGADPAHRGSRERCTSFDDVSASGRSACRDLRSDPRQGRASSARTRSGRSRRCRLGGANEAMMDATCEEERHPIGIDPPDQRPDAERGSVRGNDLQPDHGPGAKSCSGRDLSTVIADIHDLAGVALCCRFDDHRPGDSGSRMLPSISRFLTDHGLTPGNWRARTRSGMNKTT